MVEDRQLHFPHDALQIPLIVAQLHSGSVVTITHAINDLLKFGKALHRRVVKVDIRQRSLIGLHRHVKRGSRDSYVDPFLVG